MSAIYRVNQIDLSKITFSEPKANKYGGRSAKVMYEGVDGLLIQTPRMRVPPYGLSKSQEKDKQGNPIPGGKIKYSIDLAFAGYELGDEGKAADPKVREFFDLCNRLHDLLIKNAQKKSATWLDMEDCNEAVAKALVRDTVKFSKDKITKKINTMYPPNINGRLAFFDDKFKVNAFDENKVPIEDLRTAIVPRTEVIAIFKLSEVTFTQGKYGYKFEAIQLKVYRPTTLPSYAFIEDESDNQPVQSKMVDDDAEVTAMSSKRAAPSHFVEDSEDEEVKDQLDDEEEEEEERPPTPPPAKKPMTVKKPASKAVAKK